MLNLWKRRKKWLYPKINIYDLQRRIYFLEFENEYILEFVRKYLVLNRERNNNPDDSDIIENHDISIFIYNQFLGNHLKMLE
jgi:hypothetical protein